MNVSTGVVEKEDTERKQIRQQNEERKLAEMMIPKKKKRLYEKIMYGKKRKAREVWRSLDSGDRLTRASQVEAEWSIAGGLLRAVYCRRSIAGALFVYRSFAGT